MSVKESILKVIGGEHVAALATVQEGKPAVRFLALVGMDDLTLIGATMKSSRKVAQIRKTRRWLSPSGPARTTQILL